MQYLENYSKESIGDGGGGVDEREEGGVGLSGRESIGDRGVA